MATGLESASGLPPPPEAFAKYNATRDTQLRTAETVDQYHNS